MDSVLLNEAALLALPEAKRPIFVYEWLRKLDRVLTALADYSDINQVR